MLYLLTALMLLTPSVIADNVTKPATVCVTETMVSKEFPKPPLHWEFKGGSRYDEYYDPMSKLFFFFPVDLKGCLHPEKVTAVTPSHFMMVTGGLEVLA